ncbi:MAG TPA: DNA methyltransferase, partial [Bacteroidia bacterium]|nr:DNA methyltransferase [Bacteroidia bacterium]
LEYKKALSFYAVFQASLIKRPFNLFHRKNLNIRTADVKRNFGNKATWEVPFKDYLLKFATEANDLVFDSGNECKALNKSILELDPYGYDLVYIDPPYIRKEGNNESSNYFNCYHFLEGLSNYENWNNLIDYDTNNLKLKNWKDQDDFSKDKIKETFENILYIFSKNKIVLSYKKGGFPSIEFIKKTMQKMGKTVYTKSRHYQYALNHQNGDSKNNREVLIIGI